MLKHADFIKQLISLHTQIVFCAHLVIARCQQQVVNHCQVREQIKALKDHANLGLMFQVLDQLAFIGAVF